MIEAQDPDKVKVSSALGLGRNSDELLAAALHGLTTSELARRQFAETLSNFAFRNLNAEQGG